ncbi:DsrE family protein [Desulfovibrio sp. JC010]|nr:DsrE family protein [Desulfovibrio sp. JC010]
MITIIALVAAVFLSGTLGSVNAHAAKADGKLMVVWSSGDKEVAQKIALPYPMVAKEHGMFADISVLVWGASTKLLSEDAELQGFVKKLQDMGIKILVCKWCSDGYGVSDKLAKMGLEVDYMAQPLTQALKDKGWSVVTF